MGNENGEQRVEKRETVEMRIYEETKLDAEPSLNNRQQALKHRSRSTLTNYERRLAFLDFVSLYGRTQTARLADVGFQFINPIDGVYRNTLTLSAIVPGVIDQ